MPKKYTLKFTLTSSFCGLTLVGTLFLSVLTSYQVAGFIREGLRLRLTDMVNLMASQINGDLHSQIQNLEDEQGQAFRQLRKHLLDMRRQGTGIVNIYTMRQGNDGQIHFVIDLTRKAKSPIGTVYNSPTETLRKALTATTEVKNIYTEFEPSSDDLGVWLSAYAPIFTSAGQLDGILGIDVSAAQIMRNEFYHKAMVLGLSLAVGILMLPLGFVIARSIRRPLSELTDEMEKIRHFNLDGEVVIPSRIYEINSMSQQLDSMKRGLRSFKKYVPADLVQNLIEMGVDARLGGEIKPLSIFFSDIVNFTGISEQHSPEALIGYLNEYLNVMNQCLLQNQATVDKYIGDSVMAFFGAPRQVDQHEIKSCQAALTCLQQIDQMNQRWAEAGQLFAFNTRIGIHTGDVIAANIGSDARMNYTIIGDSVNLASRIESANKFYGTRILISESTYQAVKNIYVTRLIDDATVVGRIRSVRLYELIGEKSDLSEAQLSQIALYQQAFQCYHCRAFPEALTLLNDLIEQTPADRATQILLKRCQEFVVNPPDSDWRGSYILRGK